MGASLSDINCTSFDGRALRIVWRVGWRTVCTAYSACPGRAYRISQARSIGRALRQVSCARGGPSHRDDGSNDGGLFMAIEQ